MSTICDSMSDVYDIKSVLKWREFVSIVVKLGYPMLTKKMDNITDAAMWQESNISHKLQRIVLRYLSNFIGSRIVVPQYCIDELRQNHVPPQCDFFISDSKKIFLDKTYFENFNYINWKFILSRMF